MEVKQQYDYIIVEGGTAGSVVAARLAEKQGITVCLLEAGPTDAVCPEILSLNNWPNLFETDLVYNYTIEKQARGNSLCWLLGTSVRKIGGLRQYNGSHLPSCLYEKMHVSGNSRTGKLMLNENTCTYTSTRQRGNIFSSSMEGNAKIPSHVDTTILFRRMGFISPL
jgi:hypothetical protein